MSIPQAITVLILGAGPAGLALGRELSLRRIPYLILEKEAIVGPTFAYMTESTTYGPWLNNILPGSPVPWSSLLHRTTRAEYAQYLSDYARQHKLRVLTDTRVTSVHHSDHFLVETADGDTFRADYLVNATGRFSKPFMPEYPGSRTCGIPLLHSAAYRSPQTVRECTGRERAKVLIIGSGLSAGEIALELTQAGNEVHLSHRGRIEAWLSPLEETLLSPLSYLWENISLRFGLGRPSNLRPRLRRGRQASLLEKGQVRTHPDVWRMEAGKVFFSDRAVDRFDLILYATGYRPALDHLDQLFTGGPPWVSGLESVEVPNCFFLGLPDSRSFRSEFLRGIREDAVFLADLLEQRLAPPRQRGKGAPRKFTKSATMPI